MPISLSSEIKGGGNWIVQHIKALRKYANQDVEVGVICLDSKVKEFHFFEEDGIFYYNIRSFEGSKVKRILYSLGFIDVYENVISDVKQGIEHYRPDIIQIFGYESQFIGLLGHTDIPIVIHFTGFKEAYAAKVDRLKISKLKPKRKGLNKVLGLFINERKNSERVSAIGKVDYKKVSYVLGRTEWDKALTRLISPKAQYFRMEELLRESFNKIERVF